MCCRGRCTAGSAAPSRKKGSRGRKPSAQIAARGSRGSPPRYDGVTAGHRSESASAEAASSHQGYSPPMIDRFIRPLACAIVLLAGPDLFAAASPSEQLASLFKDSWEFALTRGPAVRHAHGRQPVQRPPAARNTGRSASAGPRPIASFSPGSKRSPATSSLAPSRSTTTSFAG